MTIGDAKTARMLWDHYSGDMNSGKRAPKGFNRIGMGCYRTAILDRSTNVVYKIGDYDSNLAEAGVSRKLKRKSTKSLGFNLKIPHTRTYRMPTTSYGIKEEPWPHNVVAQEFAANSSITSCNAQDMWRVNVPPCNCKGRSDICFAIVHQRIEEFSGLTDIHSSNVLIDRDRTFWLIDMAM